MELQSCIMITEQACCMHSNMALAAGYCLFSLPYGKSFFSERPRDKDVCQEIRLVP